MGTTFNKVGDLLVIDIGQKRLDAAEAPRFKQALAENVTGNPSRVVIDLGEVDFIDSTGLGTLVSLLKMMGPDGTLGVAGAGPSVRRLLAITRLDSIFSLFDSREEALAALAPGAGR